MRTLLDALNRHLDVKLGLTSRILLIVSAALLAITLTQPLWNLTMFAPQYPDGLRMDIYTHELRGGRSGQDVKEINVLNHYIGMRDLSTDDFTEFKWMPFAIGVLALVALRASVHGTTGALLDCVVLFAYFGAFSMWSFAHKLYVYGHTLSPGAAVRVTPFTPPIFGYEQIANFEVYSYPRAGTYFMLSAGVLLIAALVVTWRAGGRARADGPIAAKGAA
jgi:copper chaperone NosL